jgi:hypothetical protein
MSTYFGFAIADGMLPETCTMHRTPLTVDQASQLIDQGVVPCFNPGHEATISAMRTRFGISLLAPASASSILLSTGDRLIVMSVRGLPRLVGRHEYTRDEISSATFSFGLYIIA